VLHRRGSAYPQELRERVFAFFDAGQRVGDIARRLSVSVSYVSKTLSRRERTGVTTALPQCCHVPPRLIDLYDAIKAKVADDPDATIAELRAWLATAHQVTASNGLMAKTLVKLDLTFKKNRFALRNRSARKLPRLAPPGARSSRA
jgi:transposase